MCTPQLIEAVASAKAAQQIPPQAGPVMASGGPAVVPGQNMAPPADPISPGWANAIQGVAGLFPPNGPRVQHMMNSSISPRPIRIVPLPQVPPPDWSSRGPVYPERPNAVDDSFRSIPHEPMENIPPYLEPIRRSPTVGELLGIPPGTTPGI